MANSLNKIEPFVDEYHWPHRWNLIFAVLATFAILYNITFRFNESLTSARLAIAALFIWFFLFRRQYPASFDWRLLVVFIPVPYVIIQWIIVGDSGQFSRFFHLALYSYVGALLVSRLIGDLRVLLVVLLFVTALQAVILLFSFTSTQYRGWLDSIIVTGGNYDAFNLYRAPGLTSNAGSSLSVVQSLGVFSGGLLLMLRRGFARRLEALAILGLMLLCLVSCAVVGRTGLYLSLVFLLLSVFHSGYLWLFLTSISVVFVLFYNFGLDGIESLIPSEVSIDWIMDWMLGIFSNNDRTLSALGSMPIPSLDQIDSWHGHGLVGIINGANPSGHDSGFIQSYYSIGFIFSVILYTGYIYLLFRLLNWVPSILKWLLVAIFFGLEAKEPFLFKYAIVFVLMAMHSLAIRRNVAWQRL